MNDTKPVWSLNGVGKLLGWIVPLAAILYFAAVFFFNMGQNVQRNSDLIARHNQRICAIEEALPKPIVDADCPRR